MELIQINSNKCTQCLNCSRVCPVKAIIPIDSISTIKVIHDRCIGCGSCFKGCEANAISYHSSIEKVLELLNEPNSKVIAVVDPTISSEFEDITDYRKFAQMIKAIGFDNVVEATFAIDLLAKKYNELLIDFKGKYYISTLCIPVMYYIEKFQPELVDNLVPIVNHMTASSAVVRHFYGKDVKVVYIGPCIAMKMEIERFEGEYYTDAMITFKELRELFSTFKINESNLEFADFSLPQGNLGSLLPISNGFLQATGLEESLIDGNILVIEGETKLHTSIRQFKEHSEQLCNHICQFYCEGCAMGPGNTDNSQKYLKHSLVKNYALKRIKSLDFNVLAKNIEQTLHLSLDRTFIPNDQRLPEPSSEKVKELLKMLGKDIDQNIDCNICGFSSCNDFVKAIATGLAKPEMCLNYSLKSKQDYIKTLKNSNEKLKKNNDQLLESEKKAQFEEQLAKNTSFITSAMLQKLTAGIVIADEKLKIIMSNKSFISILGEDAKIIDEVIPGLKGADVKTLLPVHIHNLFSYVLQNNEEIINRDLQYNDKLLNISIFSINDAHIVGAIIRDLYAPEVQKEEIVKRINEVIDTNLDLVQKIAFLLGESATKTEHMLNSIIETQKKIQN
ncbi:MAG: [Fe-Fe] hydrogenase large subunit C-terminal domain-containing protein [Bacteroidota bacterium]